MLNRIIRTNVCVSFSKMMKNILLFSLLTGVFPYTFAKNCKEIFVQFSKFGLITNLCCCAFLTYEVLVLCLSILEAIQHQTPSADMKLAIKIANTGFLLIIVIRRLINSKEEAHVLNKIFKKFQQMDSHWYKDCHENGIIFCVELLEIITEQGMFCFLKFFQNRNFHTYDLTLLIRLGFETLVLTILKTEQKLYINLNNFLRYDTMKSS